MKRLWAVAILALALPGFGQIKGAPASVTSFGNGRGDTPGAPASVTSLGPHGYAPPRYSQGGQHRSGGGYSYGGGYNTMCSTPGALVPSAMGCTSTSFTNQNYSLPVNAGRSRGGYLRGRGPNYYPVYVPYAVPVVVEEEPPPQPVMVDEEADEPPAVTVFEHRAKSNVPMISKAPAIDESRVYHPAPTPPAAETREERQAPAIVLIYKDGHQREVQNYAIMGNYIYDIGTFVAQKIPLAELNLKATLKANDERGVEFSLPSSMVP